ncbi:MAG: hypothetical protein G3M78_03910 [Candidatus Nitrohelix vancouverensis]|uniref:Uncharacterized protein n=1 Tax=Candidatus Nitrohelix vancouverensis TaxID=2705534 RepID=A0A7T0C135_9BACT|nr:MAG: hypothetical protein G3M78_03910 [Candidatus Nitrohelix vancouverensis]
MTTKRISTGWRAFSTFAESSYGSPATLDTTLNFEGAPTDVEPNQTQNDEKEVTGYVEASQHETLNWKLEGAHKQRAMPHNVALFAGLVLGKVTSDQPDDVNDPDVYRHYIERDLTSPEMKSVTMAEFDGVAQKRYAGIFCKSLKLSGARGDFLKLEASFGGMGKEEASAISMPGKVAESYLRYGDVEFTRGGSLTGSVAAGDLALGSSPTSLKGVLLSFDYSVNADPKTLYEMGDNSGYVSRVERGERWKHELSATFEMADDDHKNALKNGTEYVLNLPIRGAIIGGGSDTLSYEVDLIFPRAVYREARKELEGDVVVVKSQFQILESATYGSVIIKAQNKQASYLA